jgi:hypothetical protein
MELRESECSVRIWIGLERKSERSEREIRVRLWIRIRIFVWVRVNRDRLRERGRVAEKKEGVRHGGSAWWSLGVKWQVGGG